jgi:hypothetical protein
MSVVTTADEKVSEAKESVRTAIQSLSAILIEDCWGHDGFNDDYREKLSESFDLLRQVKEKLGPQR